MSRSVYSYFYITKMDYLRHNSRIKLTDHEKYRACTKIYFVQKRWFFSFHNENISILHLDYHNIMYI